MIQIGLLSDTHGYLDENIFMHFENCNEIWHAGDFGSAEIAEKLQAFKPLRAVYGNVDGYEIRSIYPEKLVWDCEDITVYMTHIGGHPKRYEAGIKQELASKGARLFIAGHSHILKVMYDDKLQCLHMNPGAAGRQGWQKVRTVIRFVIDKREIKNCEVIELGKR
ncbi:MAG: metallophosphoesterase [Chitinophagaceae bacterium]